MTEKVQGDQAIQSAASANADVVGLDLFLSCRTTSEEEVKVIAARLKQAGYSYYFYPRDSLSDRDFEVRQRVALQTCRCVVFFIGPAGVGPNIDKQLNAGASLPAAASIMQHEVQQTVRRLGGAEVVQDALRHGEALRVPLVPVALPGAPRLADVNVGLPAFLRRVAGIEGEASLDDVADKLVARLSGVVRPQTQVLLDWESDYVAAFEAGDLDEGGELSGVLHSLLQRCRLDLQARRDSGASGSSAGETGEAQALSAWLGPDGPRNIVLTGAAGAGKSSFLAHAASVAAEGLAHGELAQASALAHALAASGSPVPILLSARALASIEANKSGADFVKELTARIAESLPEEGRSVFAQRLKARRYMILIDSLEALEPKLRERSLKALKVLAHQNPLLRIIVAAREEALKHSAACADLREDWAKLVISPLSPGDVERLLLGFQSQDRAGSALQNLVTRAGESSGALRTPLVVALASTYATSGSDAFDVAHYDNRLLRDIALEFLSARGAPANLERTLSAVAANLLDHSRNNERQGFRRHEFIEWGAEALAGAQRTAWLEGDGATLFARVHAGGAGIVEPCGDERDLECRFVHDLFRDVLAGHWLSLDKDIGAQALIERMGRLQIWEDIAEGAQLWREPLRVMMAVLAPALRKAVLEELFFVLRRPAPLALGFVSELLAQERDATNDEWAPALQEALKLNADLPHDHPSRFATSEREKIWGRIVALRNPPRGQALFPPGVNGRVSVPVELWGKQSSLVVARAPVLVRHYAKFIAAMRAPGADIARYLDGPAFDFVEKGAQAGRWSAGAGFLIDRRSPLEWRAQHTDRGGRPVVGVTWLEAVAYCAWLTQALQDRKLDTGYAADDLLGLVQVRLPTEAEWLAIADAVSDGAYPWAGGAPTRENPIANTRSAEVGGVSSVGFFDPDPKFGLYDFGANVFEWGAPIMAEGLAPPMGASWRTHDERTKKAAERIHLLPFESGNDVGFRWVAK